MSIINFQVLCLKEMSFLKQKLFPSQSTLIFIKSPESGVWENNTDQFPEFKNYLSANKCEFLPLGVCIQFLLISVGIFLCTETKIPCNTPVICEPLLSTSLALHLNASLVSGAVWWVLFSSELPEGVDGN